MTETCHRREDPHEGWYHTGPLDRLKGRFGLRCRGCNQDLCGKTWQPYGIIEGRCLNPIDHDGDHEIGKHPRSVDV